MRNYGPLWIGIAILFVSILAVGALNWVLSGGENLPYSRPHIEFENEEGKDCVGWYMNGGAGAIVLCEGEPPQIVITKQSDPKPGYNG